MSKNKIDLPVSQVRCYLEPGPIVMVSSALDGRRNIMTMGWHTVMEFTPSFIGCVIASGNYSFDLVHKSGECVINLPTTSLTDIVVGVGNTTGAEIDKFEKFGLTARAATRVGAPMITECHANFECRVADDAMVDKYNFFIFEVVRHTWPSRRSIRRHCTTPATVCSWSPARSSAGAGCSGRSCSILETKHVRAFHQPDDMGG